MTQRKFLKFTKFGALEKTGYTETAIFLLAKCFFNLKLFYCQLAIFEQRYEHSKSLYTVSHSYSILHSNNGHDTATGCMSIPKLHKPIKEVPTGN